MKKIKLLLIVTAFLGSFYIMIAQDETSESNTKPTWSFSASPSFGMTFQNISKVDEEVEELVWMLNLRARLGYEGDFMQFASFLYMQYGQHHSKTEIPYRVQDNMILSVIPSIILFPTLGIRLFLETTVETSVGKGTDPSTETSFMDPMFVYQTLFLGKKYVSNSESGSSQFYLTFGVGYALQQTFTKNYILEQNRQFPIDENNPLSNYQDDITIESGYSGIFEMGYETHIFEDLLFNASFRNVALTKKSVVEDIKDSRVGSLLFTNLQYQVFNIDYTMRILYDRNFSLRRQLDQTLVFGLRFNI